MEYIIYSGLLVNNSMVSLKSEIISSNRGLDFCTIRAAKFLVLPSNCLYHMFFSNFVQYELIS